jgi:uncharacterized protein YhbP (UPF0306 family)
MQAPTSRGEQVAIEESKEPVAEARMADTARRLLDASTLCAIATVQSDGSAYVNNAYFALSREFDLVWMSEPQAQHSRNIRERGTAAVAVYDSAQTWGGPDRGIQLFGSAREVPDQGDAEAVYAHRFPEYDREQLGAYRFYVFRPERIKLFDERELGGGVFVTARVEGGGGLGWEATEIYRAVDM